MSNLWKKYILSVIRIKCFLPWKNFDLALVISDCLVYLHCWVATAGNIYCTSLTRKFEWRISLHVTCSCVAVQSLGMMEWRWQPVPLVDWNSVVISRQGIIKYRNIRKFIYTCTYTSARAHTHAHTHTHTHKLKHTVIYMVTIKL